MNEETVARLIDDYRPEAYATAMAARDAHASIAVSYTHLTLPTSDLV